MDRKKALLIIPFVGVLMSKKRRKYSKVYKESVHLIVEKGKSNDALKGPSKTDV
jgi:hypothetical protein